MPNLVLSCHGFASRFSVKNPLTIGDENDILLIDTIS